MLAMHYAIPLSGAEQVAAIRRRAAERGPLFDGLDGLETKLFLLDPLSPCYATFYLWRESSAALAFLKGAFFAALAENFGRPEVKLLLTTATQLPPIAGEALSLEVNPARGETPWVEALDPRTGDILTLAPPEAPGRRFEVLYKALGRKT